MAITFDIGIIGRLNFGIVFSIYYEYFQYKMFGSHYFTFKKWVSRLIGKNNSLFMSLIKLIVYSQLRRFYHPFF